MEGKLKHLGLNAVEAVRTRSIVLAESSNFDVQALVNEGKIKYIGLSEVGPEDLRKAHKVHPITAVQLEWSLFTRDVEVRQILTWS